MSKNKNTRLLRLLALLLRVSVAVAPAARALAEPPVVVARGGILAMFAPRVARHRRERRAVARDARVRL